MSAVRFSCKFLESVIMFPFNFHVRDRQNAGSCELYYRWNSVTCMGKRYLLPKTIPPIDMVRFATATVLRLPKEYKSSRPPETAVPVLNKVVLAANANPAFQF